MGDQHKSEYRGLPEQLQWDTIDQSIKLPLASSWAGLSAASERRGLAGDQLQWTSVSQSSKVTLGSFGHRFSQPGSIRQLTELYKLAKHHKRLAERNAEPVTSISSFMAAVAAVDPPFKPRTLHRPWSISAGHGAHGAVEVHRYVPGRNFDVFNDSSSLKLLAYEPDPKRTGHYYAVKRLASLDPALEEGKTATKSKATSRRNSYALLADELRILSHPDLRGHANIVYLFGVSHTPSRGGVGSAEPNLVLQEGDCGDLYSFYRDVDMRFNRHTLIEVKLSLCFDIASGIEALHRHGVVHCDLKPQNILIRRRSGRDQPVLKCKSEIEAGQVALDSLVGRAPFVAMLADFGGSIIMADQASEKAHLKVFTPMWCAPECYSQEPIAKSLLPRVDIYSAGLIFAFIFLEGRDIFTKVVERGLMHQYDTALDREEVRASKASGAALARAKKEVREFETTVFGITATGQRLYVSREQMYPKVVSDIFGSILELALQADPGRRVANATDLLEPWHRTLQGNFHVNNSLHYSQPQAFRSFAAGRMGGKDYFSRAKTCAKPAGHGCSKVPSAFSNTVTDMSPGVFDIRKSFKVFRASLTSNLKTAIVNDMLVEVKLVQSIQRHTEVSRSGRALSDSRLRRAADCAYQVGVACLEGFGRSRDDQEALKWMRIAAEWGSPVAQADLLPLLVSLGVKLPDKSDAAVQWAVDSVIKQGHQGAVNALWEISQETCTDAVSKYRAGRSKELEAAFERKTAENWNELCWHKDWQTKLRKLHDSSPAFKGRGKTAQNRSWTLLHYVVVLMPARGLRKVIAQERVGFLVEKLGVDVRSLNADSATALDLAMACGSTSTVRYLLDRHELCKPAFFPGSCPLQNIACLPAKDISEIVERVCKIAPGIAIDARLMPTGRTPLLNTLLTKEPLLPPARKAAVVSLLAHRANPLLTTAEPGTASSLLLAVTGLEAVLVGPMLLAINMCGHITPVLNQAAARPEPANELARAFLRLMQTPRSVSLVTGLACSSATKTTLTTSDTEYRRSLGLIVKLMLENGISAELPHVCRGMPYDALGLACYYGRDEAMRAILACDPKDFVSAVIKTLGPGKTGGVEALGTAIECGFAEAADLLLPHMAKRSDVTAHSLLLTGAVHHQPALVQQLFGHFEHAGRGPEVLEFQDQWGATILDLALEYGYFDLARFLLGKGAKYDAYRLKGDHSIDEGTQSTLASVLPRMKPIKFLMELTPKPSLIVTSTGLNVFHLLAADEKLIGTSIGRAEFLQVLEYFHALDPTLIHARGGTQGFTPFHLVSLHYSETVGSFLHAHGADINASSSARGLTPLDLLHFHDDGDRGADEHLTVDYRTGSAPRTGVAICDFAMAGPAYWKLEAKLSTRLKELYRTWGAKRGLQTMMRQLGLQDDPMTAFWAGGITTYYKGADGKEHARHFP